MTDTTKPAAPKLSKNIAAKLETLNALRAANGKPALVTWKNAEALLDQRIQEETPSTVTYTPPSRSLAGDFLTAVKGALNGGDISLIDDAVKAGKVTVVPAASELAKPARRKAVIEQIAAQSVAADKPTTVIDAKAASRQLRAADKKAKKSMTKAKPLSKTPAKKAADAAKATAPRSTNEFSALLTELGLDPKKARQKLRTNGLSAPYTDMKKIRSILTTDGRKKAK